MLLDVCRLVVPQHKRSAVLAILHASHSGVAKRYRTATAILLAQHEKRHRALRQRLQALPGTKKQQPEANNGRI